MDVLDMCDALIPQKDSDIAILVKALLSWNVCHRCILRLMGDKQQASYKQSSAELDSWAQTCLKDVDATESTDADKADDKPSSEAQSVVDTSVLKGICVACVGILQENFCSQKFCEELHNAITKQDVEFDSYYLSLTIPVPLILREHALFIKLKQLLPDVYGNHVKENITPIKEVWKWVNGPTMSSLLQSPFDQRSPFEVKMFFVHPTLLQECNFLYDLYPDVFRKRKNNKHGWEVFTRINVPRALEDMGEARFTKFYQCPPKQLPSPCTLETINCVHESIYVAGRYNKYSRELSQTPWLVDGGRRSESSIEEMICIPLNEDILAKEYKFSSSGREDVDVLMLGRGRPFVVEMINPRRIHLTKENMKSLQDVINRNNKEYVRVRDFQIVSKEDTSNLKKGEEEKVKTYSGLCWVNKEITQDYLDSSLADVQDLVLKQNTPIRVLHRRSLAIRERTIHSASAKLRDSQHFTLYLSTQAGTYIKEFVHGDFGRTQPNMGILLNAECDILELNVEAVELDWPQRLEDSDTEDKTI